MIPYQRGMLSEGMTLGFMSQLIASKSTLFNFEVKLVILLSLLARMLKIQISKFKTAAFFILCIPPEPIFGWHFEIWICTEGSTMGIFKLC